MNDGWMIFCVLRLLDHWAEGPVPPKVREML